MGTAIWFSRMFFAADDVIIATSAHRYGDALGLFLGILFFGRFEEGWLLDHEVYVDCWDHFVGFFNYVSLAWQAVLAQPDEARGLTSPFCQTDKYRAKIVELLTDWQADVNVALRICDDIEEVGGSRARLAAITSG